MTILMRLAATALLVALAPGPVFATDFKPKAFVIAPAGLTALMGHLVSGDRKSYHR